MDTKLDRKTGDHFRDSRGIPVVIDGLEELLQRAYIAVTVPMGKIPGLRNFGGDRILVEKAVERGEGNMGFLAMVENALASADFQQDGVKVLAAILNDEGTVGTVTLGTDLGIGSFEVII